MLEILLLVAGVQFIGLISPGPDFALILRNSITYGKHTALWSAFGVAVGVLVHIAYTLTGLNFLLSAFPQMLKIIGSAGAAYLFWIGFSSLRSNSARFSTIKTTSQKKLRPFQALSMGFIINVTNPKCIIFFVSFLSAVIAADHDRITSIFIGAVLFLETWIWFSFLAIVLGQKTIQLKIQRYRHILDKIVGGLFLFFGLSMGIFIWTH
jgi:threonine/homoserine/homoserine lactone efflux protein